MECDARIECDLRTASDVAVNAVKSHQQMIHRFVSIACRSPSSAFPAHSGHAAHAGLKHDLIDVRSDQTISHVRVLIENSDLRGRHRGPVGIRAETSVANLKGRT